nr:IS30 family transposase [uncultured Dysosmobacter sp.]
MTKKQHYMTYAERIRLEEKLRYKVPIAQIARELGFSRQTIYNEIKRGQYVHTCKWWDELRYSADIGQQKLEKNKEKFGRPLKIGHDIAYADFLERKILREHYSPAAALAEARREGFKTSVCVGTLYNYITGGVFYELTNADLLEKPTRRPRKKNEEPKVAHPTLPSIEARPEQINQRSERGHWEMDLVVGPQGSRPVLLTLTERVTREEIIVKLPDKRAVTIRRAIDQLERTMPDFYQRFKSITTDNGPEFLEYDLLRKSVLGGTRFEVYYCHSYAAWEKGTNENHNRMIRRFFPKGTDFGKISKKRIAEVQNWMNGYPRKILDWKCPAELAV